MPPLPVGAANLVPVVIYLLHVAEVLLNVVDGRGKGGRGCEEAEEGEGDLVGGGRGV